MAIYAYADETVFQADALGDKKALGYGILISPVEINQSVILEALDKLRADHDFDGNKDEKTLKNGFFHASADSKNGHSHLCNAINRHVTGIFDFTFEDNIDEINIIQKKYKEKVLARCLSSSSVEFFNSVEEICLTIEKRDGFNETSAKSWVDAIYKLFEQTTYGIPSLKTFFPNIHIRLSDKMVPGLQVVDFLLWSAGRFKRKPEDNRWMKRLKFTASHWYSDEKNHHRSHYYLKNFPRPTPEYKYPHRFQKAEDWELLQNAYIIIERILVNLTHDDFPDHAKHLYPQFEVISKRLKDLAYRLTSEDLEWVGRVFLRLFDTVPLYENIPVDDTEAWTMIFHTKFLASMFVRKDQLHFMRAQNAIHSWRFRMQTDRPGELRLLQFPDSE